jgi:hypothetical protein
MQEQYTIRRTIIVLRSRQVWSCLYGSDKWSIIHTLYKYVHVPHARAPVNSDSARDVSRVGVGVSASWQKIDIIAMRDRTTGSLEKHE